jgi:hypothetical protein
VSGVGLAIVLGIGVALLGWVISVIRSDRLYVGYGVIFVFGTLGAMIVIAVPPLRRVALSVSGLLMPDPSLSGLAIIILTFLMVYAFIQISVLANRVIKLTQELAMRDARRQDDDAA